MKILLRLFKTWWYFCLVYRDEVFTYIVILFLHCSHLSYEKISSRFNELKFQHGLKISIWAAPKIEIWCRMCHGCVSDNYLSVSFPTQPYLLLFCFRWWFFFKFSIFPWNSYTCTTTGNNMVLESLVTSSNLTLHNRGTASIGHKIKH